ncbi:uncharacterized protein LOC131605803 [Vicia villosa]|uniref:uncharacterized protein LOC131605803 n=1 Tax=Vicia villosa TaxID=3911 RepID=UPI00273BF4CD|nr:uncharacterized protein LOC131605803 [Vicia villosa]
MRRLDALRLVDVIWTPYRYHMIHREFDESYLYSSHMRWETLVARHLPERCLQHYEYIKGIPRSVPNVPARGIDMWFQTNIISSARAIRDKAARVQYDSQREDGYLEWHLTVSHLRIFPPVDCTNDVWPFYIGVPYDAGVPVDDVPPLPLLPDTDD